jgi:hypothetical protein
LGNVETLRYATKSGQSSAAQRDPATSSDQIAKAQRRASALLLRAAIFSFLLEGKSERAAANLPLSLQKSAARFSALSCAT